MSVRDLKVSTRLHSLHAFGAVHRGEPVLAEDLRVVGTCDLAPACERHDHGGQVILGRHVRGERDDAVGGVPGRLRASCEVGNFVVRYDGGHAV